MEAREQRAYLKRQIALRGFPSLSLTLNIPGFPKSNTVVNAFFEYCLRDFGYFMKANLVSLIDKDAIKGCDAAGDFYIVPFSQGILSLQSIKQYCEEFEQSHTLGRFVDADLNGLDGVSVSSGKSKICFFCLERPAIDCRREQVHEPEELRSFMFPKMESFNLQKRQDEFVRKLSSFALQAILVEISLTPKPGLVDRFSNGSHLDMNFRTFLYSSSAIMPWFSELVLVGIAIDKSDLTLALPLIRKIGLKMESAMNDATGNINTQKGIIFLLGISLFACGTLFSRNIKFKIEDFREFVRSCCKDIVSNELNNQLFLEKSHGADIFRLYGISGARGEVESGFATVFDYGLPQLAEIDQINDEALMKCFIAIAANNQDTNILYRTNPEVLENFQKLCKSALEDFSAANYSSVIDFCKTNNISPGGSADLLAVTIFVWSVIRADL